VSAIIIDGKAVAAAVRGWRPMLERLRQAGHKQRERQHANANCYQ